MSLFIWKLMGLQRPYIRNCLDKKQTTISLYKLKKSRKVQILTKQSEQDEWEIHFLSSAELESLFSFLYPTLKQCYWKPGYNLRINKSLHRLVVLFAWPYFTHHLSYWIYVYIISANMSKDSIYRFERDEHFLWMKHKCSISSFSDISVSQNPLNISIVYWL